jgi:hypothetical protein
MKTKTYSFLGDNTINALSDFRNEMLCSAKTAEHFSIKDLAENPLVIEVEDFLKLLDNMPFILVYRVAKVKLGCIQVYALEKKNFEEKLACAGNIKRFLNKFPSIDPLSENVFFQMVENRSIPFNEAQKLKGEFLASPDLIANVSLRLIMARILWECDGYNNWYGTYFISETNKMMSRLNIANRLMGEKSILPVAIYHDAIDILQAVDLVNNITDFLSGGEGDPWYSTDNLERDREILEKKLKRYTEKYPCLAGKDFLKFGALLLKEYTMNPTQMIERLGPNTIAFPFALLKNDKLSTIEKYFWKNALEDSDEFTV